MGGTHFLPELVGPAIAAELLLTGRTISAEEALEMKIVSKVHTLVVLLTSLLVQVDRSKHYLNETCWTDSKYILSFNLNEQLKLQIRNMLNVN